MDIYVCCAVCGDYLKVCSEVYRQAFVQGLEITVEPCEYCLEVLKQKLLEELRNEGS